MKLTPTRTLKEIADLLGKEFVGQKDHLVTGLNEIHQVEEGDLVFVDHPKYYDKALNSPATTILINEKVDYPEGKGLIISDDPFRDYNQLTRHFSPFRPLQSDRGTNTSVDPTSIIHPGVVLGNNVTIGKEVVLHAGVVIYDNTSIGDRSIIHGNTTIGSDAFYFKNRPEGHDKLHSCGSTVVAEDVEIGALCSIDRGVSGETRIGKGTKMDNQVHIGHDCIIGTHCLFAAQVGISGCVHIGNRVTLWGQVGIVADLNIGNGAVVFGQAGISKDLEGDKTYLGSPASEAREKFKELAALRKLPALIEKL